MKSAFWPQPSQKDILIHDKWPKARMDGPRMEAGSLLASRDSDQSVSWPWLSGGWQLQTIWDRHKWSETAAWAPSWEDKRRRIPGCETQYTWPVTAETRPKLKHQSDSISQQTPLYDLWSYLLAFLYQGKPWHSDSFTKHMRSKPLETSCQLFSDWNFFVWPKIIVF